MFSCAMSKHIAVCFRVCSSAVDELKKNIPDTERALEKAKKDLADIVLREEKRSNEVSLASD